MVDWTFVEFDDVASTQAILRGLAAMGAPEGTVVTARSQSSGEGRFGRPWASPPGGLYMSFVLRPKTLPHPELASLVSATAVVRGVLHATGLHTQIRWPNDVMARGKKLAGVIAEAQTSKGEVAQIIVGVGLNCNSPMSSSGSLEGEATSLFEELGSKSEVSELRHSILDQFSDLYSKWQGGGDMVGLWREHVSTLGKVVSVKLKTDETPFTSQAVGIDTEGCLIISKGGVAMALHTADFEWLREQP